MLYVTNFNQQLQHRIRVIYALELLILGTTIRKT